MEDEKTPTTSDAEDVEAHALDRPGEAEVEAHGNLDRPGEAEREGNLDEPDVEAHGLEARPVENRPSEA